MASSMSHSAVLTANIPDRTSFGNGGMRNRMLFSYFLDPRAPLIWTFLDHRYWMCLAYFVAALFCIHLTPVARTEAYINFLGYVGLAVEATLPLPQILANQRSRSCAGFRLSVLASWLIGDAMKMCYFFGSTEVIPWSFRTCGIFQCMCDCYLGLQFWMFSISSFKPAASSPKGSGERWGAEEKDIRLS